MEETVEWLKEKDRGCGHYEYGDVCIVVGWMSGYDEEKDDTIIQSENDPTWAINASVRIHNSYMATDMDLDFDYLYWPDTHDCWNVDCTIASNENYKELAKYLLTQADEMNLYAIDEDGKILGLKSEINNEEI